MPAIALIGADGAGKTTLTRMLEDSDLLRFKYLYMGINTSSSNLALPTSRLVEFLKPRLRREEAEPQQHRGSQSSFGRTKKQPHPLWVTARLVNRVAEEWFRQLVSWYYQVQGYAMLYDRHFLFDFAPGISTDVREPLDKRLHRWLLVHLYPRPDLVIFLDAPGEVLYARKGESTVEELERRRQAFLRQGEGCAGFIRVDATQPLGDVYDQVARHIVHFAGRRS
jgi:thymidylate kinase